MPKNNLSTISQARTLEEMADFWDTHSLADYDQETYEIEMVFDPSARRTMVAIEPKLMADIAHLARLRRVSPETLINVWLRQQADLSAQV